MISLIAAAGFVVALATSAQAITPVTLPQPDAMTTQVAAACRAGGTRKLNGHANWPGEVLQHRSRVGFILPDDAACGGWSCKNVLGGL
jgi:hypothetical protein